MTAKEYLRQLWDLDREIESMCQVLEELKANIGITGISYDHDQVVSGNMPDPVLNLVEKVVDLQQEINGKVDRLVDLKAEILRLIDSMDNSGYRNVLVCRYILMQSWDDVAHSCGYSKQHIYRLHGAALQDFQKKMRVNETRRDS